MIRPPDGVLHLVLLVVGAVFVLSVLFAGTVLFVHMRRERRAERHRTLEADWEPVLLDALATPGGALPESTVPPADRLEFVWYLVQYARRLRGEERQRLEALAVPYLPGIARRARHRSPEVRARAVQTLTTLALPDYADVVLRALDDPSPLVAMTAARGLAHARHPQYAPHVLAHLEIFEEWDRRFLSSMLSGMGEAALPTLRRVLADIDASPHRRSVAAHALAGLRDLASAGTAAAMLSAETDRELLGAALLLLAAVGHADHLAAVMPLLDSPESWVRAQAVETLARLGSPEDAALLRSALTDPSPWVALRAAYGLQEIGAGAELRLLAAEPGRLGELSREVLSGAPA